MIAYKGFDKDLKGWGGFKFEPGVWYREKECKTVRNGFHCTEYSLACMQYFTIGNGTRYFQVEARGEIDEDEWRIACTEIKLIRELNLKEMAFQGLIYMVQHDKRTDWKLQAEHLSVKEDYAESDCLGIAIARGENPKVSGMIGTICGLVREREGKIETARMFTIGKEYPAGKVYGLSEDGEIRRCT